MSVTLHLAPEQDEGVIAPWLALARELALLSPLVQLQTIVEASSPSLVARPAFVLGRDPQHTPVRYLALPDEAEGSPLAEVLVALSRVGRNGSPPLPIADVPVLGQPLDLTVFVAPGCPHCPQAVRLACQLALAGPSVQTTIIDSVLFPDLARQAGVRSVPVTFVDHDLALIGVQSREELIELVQSRGTPRFEERSFRSLCETGRHDRAALLVRQGRASDLFLPAWKQSTLSDRISLLLVAEEVLRDDASALDGVVPALVALLSTADPSLRGDTADLLGRIGLPAAREALVRLADDPHPDVAEVASDALDDLDRRGR